MSKRRNNGTQDEGGWQSRVHEVRLSASALESLRVLVDADNRDLEDVIAELSADNNSVKVKYVEYFSSYTISFTLDKARPHSGGHTFWFYALKIGQGIKLMDAFRVEMLNDYLAEESITAGVGLGW